jgi:hypothetical protein
MERRVVTARVDIRAGMVTCATAYMATNPTHLRAVHEVRPTRYSGDIPFCFVEFLREDARHTAGTQQRVSEPSFVIVMRPLENREQVDLADAIVDGFMEHLKDYAHIAANMVWSTVRVSDESEDVQTTPDSIRTYPSVRFTLTDVTVMTGRTA